MDHGANHQRGIRSTIDLSKKEGLRGVGRRRAAKACARPRRGFSTWDVAGGGLEGPLDARYVGKIEP